MKFLIILFVFIFAQTDLYGQDSDTLETPEDPSSFYFFPLIYWTPQTKFAGGVVGTYIYRPDAALARSHYSSLSASFIYTQRKQFILNAGLNHFAGHRRFSIDGQYMEYPDWFWGIGNRTPDTASERYTPRKFSVTFHISRGIRSGLYLGILSEFELFRLLYFQPEGLWQQIGYGNTQNHITGGFGPSLIWDTRDQTLFPTRGYYHQVSCIPFSTLSGKGKYFLRFRFDIRTYQTFYAPHVVAVQAYGYWLFGKAPVNKYAEFGDYTLMRGYYPGRYRDRQMLATQIEYRFPLFWRIGMTAFAGLGDVSPTLAGFFKPQIKTSQGFGIRITINRNNHLNLRLDLAIRKKSVIPVLAFGEAF